MAQTLIAILIITLTVIIYLAMNRLYVRFSSPLLSPILTTVLIIIAFLICFHIPYNTYLIGGKWINFLLGPAVVALAYPLYNQRKMLMKHLAPIVTGVCIGLFVGIISGSILAFVFGLHKDMILSLLPKSITTPIAMEVSAQLGGIPAITVVFVMIAGFVGVILGPSFLKWSRINSDMGKGIALGSASHALGTSKASEYGELSFSMSSISMALTAILGAIIGSFIPFFFHI
ncbi:LrgB family protein [Peribacillus asahii]|uniref:LrgB family protein n=1 Tax=Peribacillus asahii TaxID=228899 RepID=A0A398B3A7_9BACI|nr:LrgB family protein [Peribacillus asahii]RID84061.1 LrgB family protein [Peribacillus asahii]